MSAMADSASTSQASNRGVLHFVVRPYLARVLVFGVTTFVIGLIEAGFLVVVARVALAVVDGVDSIGLIGSIRFSVLEALGVAALLLVGRFVSQLLALRLDIGINYRITSSMSRDLGTGYLRASWDVQQKQALGSLQQAVVQFPNQVSSVATSLVGALSSGLALFALLGMSLIVDISSTLLVLGILLALSMILEPIRRATRRRSQRSVDIQKSFATNVSEIANLSLEINSLGVSEQAASRLSGIITADSTARARVMQAAGVVSPMYVGLAYLAVVAGLFTLHTISNGQIDSEGTVMLIMLRTLGYGQQLQSTLTTLSQNLPYAASVLARKAEFESARVRRGGASLDHAETLRAVSLSFGYQPEAQLLHGAEFALHRGEAVALVGPSGVGKTTLVQILLGLRHPGSGEIRLDDHTQDDIDAKSWHALVTYVPQKPLLLSGTIRENVVFLREGVDDTEVWRALDQANLAQFVHSLPNGLDTMVGHNGHDLSGGQTQRLTIARALVTRPAFLILDEPTSSLDAESEAIVVEAIQSLKTTTAVLVVTHRASTLAACDRALTIDGGTVKDIPLTEATRQLS